MLFSMQNMIEPLFGTVIRTCQCDPGEAYPRPCFEAPECTGSEHAGKLRFDAKNVLGTLTKCMSAEKLCLTYRRRELNQFYLDPLETAASSGVETYR